MIVIVLGMHRSGTSLVSSILHSMGIRMGEAIHLERNDPASQPQGYWEDQDFVSLNRQIIKAAGKHWHNPPTWAEARWASRLFVDQMRQIIEEKSIALNQTDQQPDGTAWVGWGWKDPRNCLTLHAWWPFLIHRDVRLLRVERPMEAIIDSLIRRGDVLGAYGPDKQVVGWKWVATIHEARAEALLTWTKAPFERVSFPALVDKSKSRDEIAKIATFLGSEGADYQAMVSKGRGRIIHRR